MQKDEVIGQNRNAASFDYGAFSGCDALKHVAIPDSVKHVEPTAFAGCKSLDAETRERLSGLKAKPDSPYGRMQ